MANTITPRVLKGFRDFLPNQEIKRKRLISILENTFELFGFLPIDTPVLEYTEILLGKGGGETDKQVYRFTDHGKRDVAMRYDLTVPFARFMAQHRNELYLPFRRYHIAKVWRGENTQRGRYREFMQCDFDIVGTDNVSSDFEILLLMYASISSLGIEKFKIHISDRSILNKLLNILEIDNKYTEILRLIDKLPKIGKDSVYSALSELIGKDKAEKVLSFIGNDTNQSASTNSNSKLILDNIKKHLNIPDEEMLRLEQLWNLIEELKLEEFFTIDPSITRGLDYYTGVVFETFLTEAPNIGSVCSGGRYNNLASLYTKESIPGVGASIGLDRLLAALEIINPQEEETKIPAVMVMNMDNSLIGHYHQIAQTLRGSGISAEVYPSKKKLATQFSYAEKKGIPIAIICGEDEYSKNVVTVKNLQSRESYQDIALNEITYKIQELLR